MIYMIEKEKLLDNIIFINTEYSSNKLNPEIEGIDKIVSNYECNIVLNRDKEKKPLEIIGQYNINEFNIRLGKYLNINPFDRLESDLEVYKEFYELINNNLKEVFEKYDKILYITNPILKEKYRGKKIIEELIEHIYRTLYSTNILIVFLVKPIQTLKNLFFYYKTFKQIVIRTKFNSIETKQVNCNNYFNLDNLVRKYNDLETQTYKLFILAQSCGLKKIDGTEHLFYLSEKNVLENIIKKIDNKI